MRVALLLLLAVVGQSVAVWDCPFPIEDLPTYQQVAQEVLASLNTSSPKDMLSLGYGHTEAISHLQCANAAPAVRAGTAPYPKYFHPRLWPNGTVYYSIRRSEYSAAAVARLEEEIKWVDDNTCVTMMEVLTCSAGEKCVVIAPPTDETLKLFTPIGCPPDDYEHIYYVSRTNELVEGFGILDWIMWILGFLQDHNRYDRDMYLKITPANDRVDLDWMKAFFVKTIQTVVHTVFPYDSQSATHMTIDLAYYHHVNFTSLKPDHVIKDKPDGVFSPMDVQKVHYYYCPEMLTYPVSSLPPELDSSVTTSPDSIDPQQTTTESATTSPPPDTTETTSTTTAPTTMTTTTVATTTTTSDPRFTLGMKFDGLGGEPFDETFNRTTTSTTSTTTAEAVPLTTATERTTTAFPMTSSGVRLSDHSVMRMLESALLMVTMVTCWLCLITVS